MREMWRENLLRMLLATILLCLGQVAWGQTYSYRSDSFSYDTPSAAATTVSWHTTNAAACSGYPLGDDDYADVSISSATSPANDFTFTFAGISYNSVRVYSNGMLNFGTDNSGLWRDYTNSTLPAPAVSSYTGSCPGGTASNVMMVYWTDIVAGSANSTTGASVTYELLGTKPNRRFVISWVNVKLYGQTARYNFQVILYETPTSGGNSNFKYQYTSGSSTGSAATVGVQVSSSDYTQYAYNQAYIDPGTGTAILWYPSTQYTGKQAEYRFDEGLWNATAGEVRDTATGTYNAVSTGGAISTPNGKVCRGGSIPANTSTTVIDAVATPISPTSQGAIDFWYYSNVKWNSTDAMLFDATTTSARPFYLMKSSSGALKFAVTDSGGSVISITTTNQTFSASTWQHVGVTWSINPGSNQTILKIFLNGVEATTTRTTSSAGAIAALGTVNIGDNRTSGVTPSGGTGNSANGYIDEVNFYSKEINAAQALNDKNSVRTSCSSIDHFHIIHGGSAVNCDSANVTFEAHDSTHSLVSLAGTNISLTTSTNHGDWSLVTGNGAVSNAGNGAASYTFSNEAIIVLALNDSYAESTNINVTAGTYSEKSGAAGTCVASDYTFGSVCDANLTFEQAGFRVVDASGNPVGNQIAGTSSGTYYLQAVKNTCTAAGACTGVCTSLFPAGSAVTVGLAYECSDPGACQSGQTLTFSPAASAGSASNIAGNAKAAVTATSGSYSSSALTFNAASPNPLPAVPFSLNYSDVGKIRFWARYPATSTSPTISGSSALFVVKPAGFVLTEIKPTANQSGRCAVATTPAPTITCATTAADSAKFAKAGEAFSLTVTAVNSNGNATPNFGQESAPEAVKLTLSSALTGMNTVPSIVGNLGSFSAGKATGNAFSWAEVGIINLKPSLADADYLGAGDVTGTTSANIGRFIPDHIDAVVTDGCTAGAFTYSGQPFLLELSARNLAGNLTTNYSGSAALSRAVTLPNQTLGSFSVAPASPPATIAAASFSGGVASASPAFTFTTAATVPTTITVAGQDADGVTLTASTDTTKKQTSSIRSGRLFLGNAYGSEFLPLAVPVQTQYWDSGWKQNRQDSCTVLTMPTAGNGGLVFSSPPQTSRNQLESGEVVAQMNGLTTASVTVSAGDAKMVLRGPSSSTAGPGAGNFGYVDVIGGKLSAWSWLVASGNARACFGTCGPRSPVIYFRERY